MSIFDKNLTYLKKNQPDLYERIIEKNTELEPEISYEKEGGRYIAIASHKNIRCFVYSLYSAPAELNSMFAEVPSDADQIMIFGFALGASVQYALTKQNFPGLKSLIIVEPSLKWFKIAMNQVDFEQLLEKDSAKIVLIVGYSAKDAGKKLAEENKFFRKSYLNVCHLPARTLFEEYYSRLAAQFTEEKRIQTMVMKNEQATLYRVVYNQILNLMTPAYEFETIAALFKNKRVIIVSAGPSLEKNIGLLEEAKKKAIIIAVGTAIRILDDRGITPHFRLAIDPWQTEGIIFSNLKENSVPLIYSDQLYPGIIADYQGSLIRLFLESDFIGKALRKQKETSFKSGPTAANCAAETVCQAGCEKVVFVGQDMCMYDLRVHADTAEDTYNKNIMKLDPSRFLQLKDIFGNEVIAPLNYYLIKQKLEDLINRFESRVEFINATEGGLGIDGAPDKRLLEVLASWENDDTDDIATVIAEYLRTTQPVGFKKEFSKWPETLNKITFLNDKNLEGLQKISDILIKNDKLISRDKFIKTFMEVQKTGLKLKEIDLYSDCIEPGITFILEPYYGYWEKDLDSADELVKFRSILELQLHTTQHVKKYIDVIKEAFNKFFTLN